jgi:hypothetical protein
MMPDFLLPHILVEKVYEKLGHGAYKKDTNRQAQLVIRCPRRKARFVIYKELDSTDIKVHFLLLGGPVLGVGISLYRPDFDPIKMVDDVVCVIKTIKKWHMEHPRTAFPTDPCPILNGLRAEWQAIGSVKGEN